MNIRLPLFFLTLVLALAPALRADDAKPAAPAAPAAAKAKEADDDETELGDDMHKMSSAFKKLKKQVADPSKNAASLELVATMRQYAEASLKLTPAKADDIPATDRAKFESDFQAKIKSLLDEIGKLEAALKDNKNDEAQKIVAELGTIEKAGHKDFQRPKKKD